MFRIFATNDRHRTHEAARTAAVAAGHNGYIRENRQGVSVEWVPVKDGRASSAVPSVGEDRGSGNEPCKLGATTLN